MRPEESIGRIALRSEEAAEVLGVSRETWDKLWKTEQAPQPVRFTQRLCVWSRDELRAWVANGCPPAEDWRRLWNRMLEKGSWATPDIYVSAPAVNPSGANAGAQG